MTTTATTTTKLTLPNPVMTPLALFLLTVITLTNLPLALAACECGYLASVRPNETDTSTHTTALFTDVLETDFSRLLLADNNGNSARSIVGIDLYQHTPHWAPQEFNLTKERARGTYGQMFDARNVRVVESREGRRSRGQGGGVGVLELLVQSEIVEGMVPVAELATKRRDVMWGTFRVWMKVSEVRGTCAAFFWYFNDTQEIDMEFLSRDFDPAANRFPVNLVLQSPASADAGHDASSADSTAAGNFVQANLPFDPTADFHEYRFDYLPGLVVFYADGVPLASMSASASGAAVPSSAGILMLSHWSNGNPLWSGGPPEVDSALQVKSVKAYFNASSVPGHRQRREEPGASRCVDPAAPGAVCRIPDVVPGNRSAAEWFFTEQGSQSLRDGQKGEEENGAWKGGHGSGGWVMMWWLVVLVVPLAAGWTEGLF
ncbi:hypothetical protein VTJ83DRAFT_2600 [Remersonia thermophila]|uniref:GH16 domain-containing protein n=1 Tax=Remersonia thermophila TaxID=72144 RepID=A0ABR4DJH5_9PEZI